MEYRCSNCHQPTTPIPCSVGVSGDCCEEAEVEVKDSAVDGRYVFYRPLTAFEEDELKRELFDGLPSAQRRSIERSNES